MNKAFRFFLTTSVFSVLMLSLLEEKQLFGQSIITYVLDGKVHHENNPNKKVEGVKLLLYTSEAGKKHYSFTQKAATSDEKGRFSFDLDADNDYLIYAVADGMSSPPLVMLKSNVSQGQKINVSLALVKEPIFSAACIYTNVKDLTFLPGVKATLKDNETSTTIEVVSNEKGECFFPLEKGHTYSLNAFKEGYFNPKQNLVVAKETEEGKAAKRNLLLKFQLEKMQKGKVNRLNEFGFGINDSDVDDALANELNALVSFLKKNPKVKIEIATHTDSRGDAEYNRELSEERAESIKAYLVEQGVDYVQVIAKGYGESMLLNQCADGVRCSGSLHSVNRRVEYKIIGEVGKD